MSRGAGPLHIERVVKLAGRRKCFAHIVIRTTQLEHHGGVGVGEPTGQFGDRQRARQHRQHLVPGHQRCRDGRRRGAHRRHARHDDGVEPLRQPGVQMHVGAVEQRVALGEQRHVASGIQVCGDAPGGVGVEVLDRAGVAAGMIGRFGGHRIDQVLLDLPGPQVGFGDAAGDAAPVPGAVIGHHVGLADHPGGLDGHQLRVAGPQPDPPERAPRRHSRSAAIALTAAAAMALPPRRPGHHQIGHAARSVDELLLGLRRADETDRPAQHRDRRRNPLVDQFQQPEQGGGRIADRQHRAGQPVGPQLHGGRRAGGVPTSRQLGRPRIGHQRHDLVVGGQPCGGDPGGHHRRIAQHRGAAAQRGAGPGDDVVGVGDVLGDVDLPAGMDQPDHHPRDVGGESGQVGFGADGRERLTVDLVGVAQVVEHSLTLRPAVGAVSVAGGHQHFARRRAAAGAFAADEVAVHARHPAFSASSRRPLARRRPSARSPGCRCRR